MQRCLIYVLSTILFLFAQTHPMNNDQLKAVHISYQTCKRRRPQIKITQNPTSPTMCDVQLKSNEFCNVGVKVVVFWSSALGGGAVGALIGGPPGAVIGALIAGGARVPSLKKTFNQECKKKLE